MTYEFWLNLDVVDTEALLAAAQQHPDGVHSDLVDADGNVNITACLITLLDPGSLAGCSINDSGVTGHGL